MAELPLNALKKRYNFYYIYNLLEIMIGIHIRIKYD